MQDHSTVIPSTPLSFTQKEGHTKRNLAFVRELDSRMKSDINAGRRKLFNSVSPGQPRGIQFTSNLRQNQVFFRANGNNRHLQHERSNPDLANQLQRPGFSQIPEETDVLINKLILQLNETKRQRDVLRHQNAFKGQLQTEAMQKAHLTISQLQQIIKQNDYSTKEAIFKIQQEKEQLKLKNQQMILTIQHSFKTKNDRSEIVQPKSCNRCEQLQQRLKQIERQLQSLNLKYEKQLQKVEVLNDQKLRYLTDFQQKIGNLEIQLNSNHHQVAILSQQKRQLQAIVFKIRNDQQVQMEQYENVRFQYESLLQQNKRLQNDYETLSFRNTQIASELNFITQKIYELHLQIGTVQRQGQEAELGDMLHNLGAKFTEHRVIIHEKSAIMSQLQFKIEQQELELNNVKVQVQEYRQKMFYDEQNYIKRIQELQARDKQSEYTNKLNEQYSIKIRELGLKNQQLMDKVKELQIFINQSGENQDLPEESEQHLIQRERLITEIQSRSQEAEHIRAKLLQTQALLRQKDAAIDETKSRLQQTEQFMQTVLSQQLQQQTASINQLLADNQGLQNQNFALKSAAERAASLEQANKMCAVETSCLTEENQQLANRATVLENTLSEIQAAFQCTLQQKKMAQLQLLELRQRSEGQQTQESPYKVKYNEEIANLQKQLNESWEEQQRLKNQNLHRHNQDIILMQQRYQQKLKILDQGFLQRLQSETKNLRNQFETQSKRKISQKDLTIASLSASSEKYGEILIKYNTLNINFQTFLAKNRQKEQSFIQQIHQLELTLQNSRKQAEEKISELSQNNQKLHLQFAQTYKNLQNAENYICQLMEKVKNLQNPHQKPATTNVDTNSVIEQVKNQLIFNFGKEREQIVAKYETELLSKQNTAIYNENLINDQINALRQRKSEIDELRNLLNEKEKQNMLLSNQNKVVSQLAQERDRLFTLYQQNIRQNQQLNRKVALLSTTNTQNTTKNKALFQPQINEDRNLLLNQLQQQQRQSENLRYQLLQKTQIIKSMQLKIHQSFQRNQRSDPQQQRLTAQLERKQAEINQLIDKIDQLLLTNQNKENQCKLMLQQSNQLRNSLAFKEDQIFRLNQQLQRNTLSLPIQQSSQQSHLFQIIQQNSLLKGQLQHLENLNAQLEDQIRRVVSENDNYENRYNRLLQQIAQDNTKQPTVQQDRQSTKTAQIKRQEGTMNLGVRLAQLQQTHGSSQLELLKLQNDELRSSIHFKDGEARRTTASFQARIQEIVLSHTKELNFVRSQLQAQVQTLAFRSRTQQQETEKLSQVNRIIGQQNATLDYQRGLMLKDIQILSQDKNKNQLEIQNLIRKCSFLEHQLNSLDAQLANKNIQIQSIKLQLHQKTSINTDNKTYEDKIIEIEKRKNSEILQLRQRQQQLQQASKSVQQLRTANSKLQNQLRYKIEETLTLRTTIQELQNSSKNTSRRKDRSEYRQGLSKVDQELQQSRRQLTGADSHIRLLQQAIIRAQQQIKSLNGYILDLQRKSEASQKSQSSLKKIEYQLQIQQLKSQIQQLNYQNNERVQKISSLEVQIIALATQNERPIVRQKQENVQNAQKVQEMLLKDIDFFKSKLDQAEGYIFHLEKKIQQQKITILGEGGNAQFEKLGNNIRHLQNLLNEKDRFATSSNNKISELENILRSQVQSKNLAINKLADLENILGNMVMIQEQQKLSKHNKMAEFEGAIKALEEENRRLTKLEAQVLRQANQAKSKVAWLQKEIILVESNWRDKLEKQAKQRQELWLSQQNLKSHIQQLQMKAKVQQAELQQSKFITQGLQVKMIDLNDKIHLIEQTKAKQIRQLESINSKLVQDQRNNNHQQQLAEIKAKHSIVLQQIAKLEQTANLQFNILKQNQEQFNAKSHQLQFFKNKLSQAQEYIYRLQNKNIIESAAAEAQVEKIAKLEQKIVFLKTQAENQQNPTVSGLLQQIKQSKESIRDLQHDIANITHKFSQTQSSYEAIKSNLNTVAGQAEMYQIEINRLKIQKLQIQEAVFQTRTELTNTQAELMFFKNKLTQAEDFIRCLQSLRNDEENKTSIDVDSDEMERLNEEIKVLTSKNSQLQSDKSKLINQLLAKAQQLKQISSNLQNNQLELEQAMAKLEYLEESKKRADQKINQYKLEIEKVTAQSAFFKDKLRQAENYINFLEGEKAKENANTHPKQPQASTAQLTAIIYNLQYSVKSLEAQKNHLVIQLENKNRQLQAEDKQITALKKQREDFVERVTYSENLLIGNVEKIEDLQTQLREADQKLATISNKPNYKDQQYEKIISKLTQRNYQLEQGLSFSYKTIEQLKSSIRQQQAQQKAVIQQQISQKVETTPVAKNNLTEIQREDQQFFKNKLLQAESYIEELQKQKAIIESALSVTEANCIKYQTDTQLLRKELLMAASGHKILESNIVELNWVNENLKKSLETAASQTNNSAALQLSQQNNQLKAELLEVQANSRISLQNLNNKYEELKLSYENQKRKLYDSQQAKSKLDIEFQKRNSMIQTLEGKLEQAQNLAVNLELTKQDNQGSINSRSSFEQLQSTAQKLQERNNLLVSQLQESQSKLINTQKTSTALNAQIDFLKNKLLSSQRLIIDLQKQVKQKQAQIFNDQKSHLQKQKIVELQQKYRQIEIKLILSEQNQRRYIQTIEALQTNPNAFALPQIEVKPNTGSTPKETTVKTYGKTPQEQEEVVFFKGKLLEAEKIISTLTKENKDLKEATAAPQKYQNLINEIQSLNQQNQALHEQLVTVESLKKEAQQNCQEMHSSFDELNSTLNAKIVEIDILAKQINKLQHLLEIQQIKYADDVGQLRRQLIQSNGRIILLEQENEKIEQQNQQRKEKIENLQAELDSKSQSNSSNDLTSAFFKEKLFQAESFIKELQDQNGALKAELKDLRISIQILRQQILSLKERQVLSQSQSLQRSKLQQKNIQQLKIVQEQLTLVNSLNLELKQKLQTINTKNLETIKQQKQYTGFEVNFLKDKLYNAQTYIVELQKEIEKLTNWNINKQATIRQLQEKIDLLSAKQRQNLDIAVNLTNQESSLKQKLFQAESCITELQRENEGLNQSVGDLTRKMNKLLAQLQALLQKINQADTDKLLLSSELRTLNEQNLQLRDQLEKQHTLFLAATAGSQLERQRLSLLVKQKQELQKSFYEQKLKNNVEMGLLRNKLQQQANSLQLTLQRSNQLVTKNLQLQGRKSQLQDSVRLQETSINNMSKSMTLKEDRLSQIEPIIDQLTSAQNQISILQEQKNAHYTNTSELLNQINRISDENHALTEKLENLSKIEEQELALAHSELNNLKSECQALKKENYSLTVQVDALTQQSNQKAHQLQQKNQINHLESTARQQLNDNAQLLYKQIAKLKARILVLENVQEDFQKFKATLKQKEAADKELAEIQKEAYQDKKSQEKMASQESKSLKLKNKEIQQSLEEAKRELQNELNLERVQLQLQHQRQQLILAKSQLFLLRNRISQYEQENQSLGVQINEQQKLINGQNAQIADLTAARLRQKEEMLREKEIIEQDSTLAAKKISQKELQFQGKEEKIGSSIRKLIDITNNFHQEERADPTEVLNELQPFPYLNELITSILYRLRLSSAIQLQKSLKIQSLKAELSALKFNLQPGNQLLELVALNEKLVQQNAKLKRSVFQLSNENEKLSNLGAHNQRKQQSGLKNYASLQESIAKMQSQNAELRKEISQYKELGMGSDKYDQLLKQCADYQIQNNQLEQQLRGITEANDRQKEKLRDYEEQIQTLLSGSQNRDLYQQNLSLKEKLSSSQRLVSSIRQQDSQGSINTQNLFKLQFLHLCLNKVDQIESEVKNVESEIENLSQRGIGNNVPPSSDAKPEDSHLMDRLQELEEQLLKNAENIRQHHQRSDGELYVLLKELVNDEQIPAKSRQKIEDYLEQLQQQILREYQEHQNEVAILREHVVPNSHEKQGPVSDRSRENMIRQIQNLNNAIEIYHQETMRRKRVYKRVLQSLMLDVQQLNRKQEAQEHLQIVKKIEQAIERNDQQDLQFGDQDFILTPSANVELLGDELQQRQKDKKLQNRQDLSMQNGEDSKPFVQFLLSAEDIDKEDLKLLKEKIAELQGREIEQTLAILKSKERKLREVLRLANKETSAQQIQNIMVTLANNYSRDEICQIFDSENNEELINKLNEALSLQESFYRGLNSSLMMREIQQRKRKYYETPTKLSEQVFRHLLGLLMAKKDEQFYEQVDSLFHSMYEIEDGFETSLRKKDEIYRLHNQRMNQIFNKSSSEHSNSEGHMADMERGHLEEIKLEPSSERKPYRSEEDSDLEGSPQIQ